MEETLKNILNELQKINKRLERLEERVSDLEIDTNYFSEKFGIQEVKLNNLDKRTKVNQE